MTLEKFGLVSQDQIKGRLKGGRDGLKLNEGKRRAKAKKEVVTSLTNLFDSKEQHPIIEFKPEEEDAESASLTPSFVLEVTWPRVVLLYHPQSPRCKKIQFLYVQVARGVKRRSSRLPVEFYAVNCGKYRDVCESDQGFSIQTVPTLVGLRSGQIDSFELDFASPSSVQGIETIDKTVESVAQQMGLSLDKAKGSGSVSSAFAHDMDAESVLEGVDASQMFESRRAENNVYDSPVSFTEAVFHDAKASLILTLTSSIQYPPGSAEIRVLSDFFDLLQWALPPETKVHNLAEDLSKDAAGWKKSKPGLLRILDKHTDYRKKQIWSSRCAAGAGGYSCGLWSLLHIVSVGVAERHSSVLGSSRISVLQSGEVVKSFIETFFIGCQSCRVLFMDLYDEHAEKSLALKNAESNEDWRSLAIWFWDIHNEITIRSSVKRMKGKRRMALSSSLWPSGSECHACWRKSLMDDTGQVLSMYSYDMDELYMFLKKIYWPSVVNNRLIVLSRWSRAKRSLSMKRLRERMAAKEFSTFAIVFHFTVVYLACIIVCPARWKHFFQRLFKEVVCGIRHDEKKRPYRTLNLPKARDRKSRNTRIVSKDRPLSFLSDKNALATFHHSSRCSNGRKRRLKKKNAKTPSTKESRYQSAELRKLSFLEL